MLTLQRRRPTPQAPAPATPAQPQAPGATVRARSHGPDAARAASEDWSRVWFALMAHDWRSLALISASTAHSVVPVAERFAECARLYRSVPLCVIDAHHATPEDMEEYTTAVADALAARERVLLVLPSPLARAGAIPLARAADAAVLVVRLGAVGVREARRAVAAVGHAQFLGSVTVRDG